MFTLNDMRTLLKARPFVPFRLWMNDGGHVDILRPDLALPGRHYAIVGLLDPDTADEGYDRYVLAWYMNVTRHEALAPQEPPTGTPEQTTGS